MKTEKHSDIPFTKGRGSVHLRPTLRLCLRASHSSGVLSYKAGSAFLSPQWLVREKLVCLHTNGLFNFFSLLVLGPLDLVEVLTGNSGVFGIDPVINLI